MFNNMAWYTLCGSMLLIWYIWYLIQGVRAIGNKYHRLAAIAWEVSSHIFLLFFLAVAVYKVRGGIMIYPAFWVYALFHVSIFLAVLLKGANRPHTVGARLFFDTMSLIVVLLITVIVGASWHPTMMVFPILSLFRLLSVKID